ncbi:MAG: PspA/IM30 family protein [Rhodocyclaceae bacterium]|nr:PspA/IM30 family protein [Rhodocyclaceae bacterium]
MSSVFTKMLTLVRGSAREIGESVVDANATRIYEQEVHEARNAVATAKQELTVVMAKATQTAREIERLKKEITRYEQLAVEALGKQEEALAEEVAGKVGELEAELDEQTRAHADFTVNVANLKDLIRNAEARLREHDRELAVARTTESVYKATMTISGAVGASGSKLMSAKESLERIKQRHADMADRMAAADELDQEFGHRALDKKLAAAGIGDTSDRKAQALSRIRQQHAARAGKEGT